MLRYFFMVIFIIVSFCVSCFFVSHKGKEKKFKNYTQIECFPKIGDSRETVETCFGKPFKPATWIVPQDNKIIDWTDPCNEKEEINETTKEGLKVTGSEFKIITTEDGEKKYFDVLVIYNDDKAVLINKLRSNKK